MPLFFQHKIDNDTQLAIWKIEEEETFFTAEVSLQREITHPHKRLQHLAGRYLLKYLFPDFPIELIQVADTRKPFLQDEAYHFSISHCGDYAAAFVSKYKRVGLDIELVTPKVQRIRHKFASAQEQEMLHAESSMFNKLDGNEHPTINHQLILLWSCKEAVFKWYGLGNVDFKEHMQVKDLKSKSAKQFQATIYFKKNEDQVLDLHSHFFNDLCLSYVFT